MANILYIVQCFSMDSEPADEGQRHFKHAQALIADGHSVTVMTADHGVLGSENKINRLILDQHVQPGLRVIRIGAPLLNTPAWFNRTFGILLVIWQLWLKGLALIFREKQRFGFVLASSPPLLMAWVASILSQLHRADFYLEVSTTSKQRMPITNAMSQPLLKMVQTLEQWLYRKARRIIIVSPGLANTLEKQMPSVSHKIECIPNGADLDYYQYPQLSKETYLRGTWDDQSLFHVNYAGDFTEETKPEVLLAVAAVMQERHPDIRFNFSGSGHRFGQIRRRAEEYGLGNIKFWEAFPKKRMSKFLMEGDLSILHYQALPSYATLLPNVLFDYLAAGRPVIAAMPDGETSRVLRQSKAGMVVPPENVMAIVEAISWFYEHPRQGLKMGVQAYNFAARNFDRRQLVNRLLVLFPRAIPQPVGTSRDSGINADIRIANLP